MCVVSDAVSFCYLFCTSSSQGKAGLPSCRFFCSLHISVFCANLSDGNCISLNRSTKAHDTTSMRLSKLKKTSCIQALGYEASCNVCRRVAAFIDIEAEASDEEEDESADDEEDDADEELAEGDAMFVNDASPASTRSQPERG